MTRMADPEQLQTRIPTVLEDPSAQAVARVYADAFLKAARGAGVEGALEEFGSFIAEVLDKNPQFQQLLLSGIVNRDEKVGIIERVVAPRGTPLFTNFLKVLAKHDRLDLLPAILRESRAMHEKASGLGRVRVTSAQPLSGDELGGIRERLKGSLPFDPILENKVDPSLLGGLVIQVGDTVHDSSLRTRLKQLRLRLRQRSLHEIQSGRDRFSSPEGN
jgi:F-type H+-transporting ATPase subunit delta